MQTELAASRPRRRTVALATVIAPSHGAAGGHAPARCGAASSASTSRPRRSRTPRATRRAAAREQPGEGVRRRTPGSAPSSARLTTSRRSAGFTVWKCLAVLAVVGAVWGLLTGTRSAAGRGGRRSLGAAARRPDHSQAVPPPRRLSASACGLAVLWAVTAVITVVVGRSSEGPDRSRRGALPRRRRRSGRRRCSSPSEPWPASWPPRAARPPPTPAAPSGPAYALRMVADSGTGLGWLRWASPLGWVEELQPLTAPHPLALLPIAGLVALACALTVRLAGRS